jgi:hypothetical protein
VVIFNIFCYAVAGSVVVGMFSFIALLVYELLEDDYNDTPYDED